MSLSCTYQCYIAYDFVKKVATVVPIVITALLLGLSAKSVILSESYCYLDQQHSLSCEAVMLKSCINR